MRDSLHPDFTLRRHGERMHARFTTPTPSVLVADGHHLLRRRICTALRDEGFAIIEAESSRGALDGTADEQPSVALLDYLLPGLTGVQLGAILRYQFGRALPLIVMSSVPVPRSELHQIDRVVLLRKPFDLDEVVDTVRFAVTP